MIVILFCGLEVITLGVEEWHEHVQRARWDAGTKVFAKIVAIRSCYKGSMHATVTFLNRIDGKSTMCRTEIEARPCGDFVGRNVRIVPQANTCFGVAGPYEPPYP